MKLRYFLWLAAVCRWLADEMDSAELQLLAAAKREGWEPDTAAKDLGIKAREHRERVKTTINEIRARMNKPPLKNP